MMKRLFFLFVTGVLLSAWMAPTAFAGETDPKQKMIRGKISTVNCDTGMIAVSEVSDLKSKKKLPNVTFKLSETTKLSGAKDCKEIAAGMKIIAAYVEGDQGNALVELILPRMKEIEKRLQERNVTREMMEKKAEEARKKIQERGSAAKGDSEKNGTKNGQSVEKDPVEGSK